MKQENLFDSSEYQKQSVRIGMSIVGSNKESRKLNDFYATPEYATLALLGKESFYGSVLEPACGTGDISRVLMNNGLSVDSQDLIDRGFGNTGFDFMKQQKQYDNIITNPPFNLAQEFIEKSKKIANKKIAMLLKTTFLESEIRYRMFKDSVFPLKVMYQFSKRISFGDKEYSGPPMIDWLI